MELRTAVKNGVNSHHTSLQLSKAKESVKKQPSANVSFFKTFFIILKKPPAA